MTKLSIQLSKEITEIHSGLTIKQKLLFLEELDKFIAKYFNKKLDKRIKSEKFADALMRTPEWKTK